MQLQHIDVGILDYSSSKVKFVANSREKSINDLSMYGSAVVPAKSTARTKQKKVTRKYEEIKTQAVSGTYRVISLFEFKLF